MPFWNKKPAPPTPTDGRLYRCSVCQKESRIPDDKDDPAACDSCLTKARRRNKNRNVPDSTGHAAMIRQQDDEHVFNRRATYFIFFVAVFAIVMLVAVLNGRR